MPAYNAGKHIKYAIDSISSQSYKNWELLIVDDQSTDDTRYIAQGCIRIDRRIRLIKNEKRGVSSARNMGLEEAIGEIITFLDADDYYFEDALRDRVHHLVTNPDYYAVYCLTEIVDENLKKLNWVLGSRPVITFRDMHTCPFHINSLMLRAKLFDRFRFNENFSNGEDWLLWQRIARTGINYHLVDTCKVAYRLHRGSTVFNDLIKHENMLLKVISIIYGLDPDCPDSHPLYSKGLKEPSKDIVVLMRRFGLLFYLLLINEKEKAQLIAKEFSPTIWGKVNIYLIARIIKFTIMRCFICDSNEWKFFWRKELRKIKPFLDINFPPNLYPNMGKRLFRVINNLYIYEFLYNIKIIRYLYRLITKNQPE